MVFMDIINLDDSADDSEATIGSPITNEDVSPFCTKKRKKSLKQNRYSLRAIKKIKYKFNPIMNYATERNPVSIKNSNSPKRKLQNTNKKGRKKKKSSIIVLDSEDDCVVIDESLCKENNVNNDVSPLSNNTVIELSDNEDEPCTTGLNNNTQNLINNRNNNNKPKRKFRDKFRDKFRNNKRQEDVGTSSGTITTLEKDTIIPKQTSRQSISYHPLGTLTITEGRRPIVIDGSNVAFGHGKKERFSARGIEICIDYFLRRKHTDIHAFVPQFRRRHPTTIGFHIMDKLEQQGYLVYTPSRQVEGKMIASYDDRFIVEYAAKSGGIVITRDNYKDLLAENPAWSDTINFRLLQFTFVGDMIMFPQDPLGRGGPTLDAFLMF